MTWIIRYRNKKFEVVNREVDGADKNKGAMRFAMFDTEKEAVDYLEKMKDLGINEKF